MFACPDKTKDKRMYTEALLIFDPIISNIHIITIRLTFTYDLEKKSESTVHSASGYLTN